MSKAPTEYAIGSTVKFIAGPTKVERTGTVTGHDKQFVVVDAQVNGKTKSLKTRPGLIVA